MAFNRGHGVVVNIPALGAGDRGFKDDRKLASSIMRDAEVITFIPLSSDRPIYSRFPAIAAHV